MCRSWQSVFKLCYERSITILTLPFFVYPGQIDVCPLVYPRYTFIPQVYPRYTSVPKCIPDTLPSPSVSQIHFRPQSVSQIHFHPLVYPRYTSSPSVSQIHLQVSHLGKQQMHLLQQVLAPDWSDSYVSEVHYWKCISGAQKAEHRPHCVSPLVSMFSRRLAFLACLSWSLKQMIFMVYVARGFPSFSVSIHVDLIGAAHST